MFRFFYSKKWLPWSIFGTALILFTTWYQVELDVKINDWFGTFYDVLQKALATPDSVSETEFMFLIMSFGYIAGTWILISTAKDFFTSHWVFRWRTSMTEYYHIYFSNARGLEGSSQRVQEDTLKFARIMETIGVGFIDTIMTLGAFTPILWELSKKVTILPWIGPVDHALVWVAILSALGGTIVLALVGVKLPEIEYDIQLEESSYRKELVLGEDDVMKAPPDILQDLFDRVRKIHYKSYLNFGYFNLVKWSYLQGMVIVPYIALAPTIVSGAITLGFVQQIVRAFSRVENSLQFLIRSWTTIVELISVYKRLHEFERKLTKNIVDKKTIDI